MTVYTIRRVLAFVALAAVIACAVWLSAQAQADATTDQPSGSDANHESNWEAWLSGQGVNAECYKHGDSGSNAHGRVRTGNYGKTYVQLNEFDQGWFGDRWALLVVKGGTANNVTVNPSAGEAYYAPTNPANQKPFDVSHWIVCKGETTATTVETTTSTVPETTTTTEQVTTTTVPETTTTVPEVCEWDGTLHPLDDDCTPPTTTPPTTVPPTTVPPVDPPTYECDGTGDGINEHNYNDPDDGICAEEAPPVVTEPPAEASSVSLVKDEPQLPVTGRPLDALIAIAALLAALGLLTLIGERKGTVR